MSYQNISVELPEETIIEIKNFYTELNNRFGFLIALTPKERQAMVKVRDYGLIKDCMVAAKANMDIIPTAFNMAEYEKDVTLYNVLSDFIAMTLSLLERLEHTHMAVGSEAQMSTLTLYGYLQQGERLKPGLQEINKKLAAYYKKTSAAEEIPPVEDPSGE